MIRKALLFAACIGVSLLASAQFKKGMWFTGGNIGTGLFSSDKQDVTFPPPTQGYELKENNFSITLTPFFGRFISDRTAIGAALSIGFNNKTTSFKGANGNTFRKDELNTNDDGLSIFARTYFSPGESPLNIYAQLSIGAGFSSIKSNGFMFGTNYKETYDGKSSGGFYFTPGLGVGLSKRIGELTTFEFGMQTQYRFSKYDIRSTTLRDDNIDGTIDVTLISEPSYDQKKQTLTFNAGFIFFFEKIKSKK